MRLKDRGEPEPEPPYTDPGKTARPKVKGQRSGIKGQGSKGKGQRSGVSPAAVRVT